MVSEEFVNFVKWQAAQALSELLPEGDKEKQMLQGLLYSRGGFATAETPGKKQKTLTLNYKVGS